VVAFVAVLAACHKSRGGGPQEPEPASYLAAAVDTTRMFRWTRRNGDSQTIVPIEVDDVNLPPGLTRTRARDTFERSRDVWRNAQTGSELTTSTRFLSSSAPFPSERFVLRVGFVSSLPGKLGRVSSTISGNQLQSLTMQVAVRNPIDNALLSDRVFQQAVTHELGHSFGLLVFSSTFSGHSSSDKDIMFFQNSANSPELLSTSDRLTFVDLYSRTPQVTRRQD
jgi:hypothetical protein